jgi:hypothetical protein
VQFSAVPTPAVSGLQIDIDNGTMKFAVAVKGPVICMFCVAEAQPGLHVIPVQVLNVMPTFGAAKRVTVAPDVNHWFNGLPLAVTVPELAGFCNRERKNCPWNVTESVLEGLATVRIVVPLAPAVTRYCVPAPQDCGEGTVYV